MGKYFKYAVGEILLVVIGILIALQINNWNEKRKNEEKVNILLLKIQKDLESDINEVMSLARFYSRKDSLINLVLSNKLTKEDYQSPSSGDLHYLVRNLLRINLRNNGYENLMRVQDIIPQKFDSIMAQLTVQYNDHFVYAEDAERSFIEDFSYVDKYLFENYEWKSDQSVIFENEERIDFFLNNIRYKGIVADYQSGAIRNYLRLNVDYANTAMDTYRQISELLHIDESETLKPFTRDSILDGTFKTLFGDEIQFITDGYREYFTDDEDTVDAFQYDRNKFYIQRGFMRIEQVNDSINMYSTSFENGKKAIGTKID